MDIRLLIASGLGSVPNLLSVIKNDVNNNCCQGREGETVIQDECRSEKHWRVFFVFLIVEREAGAKDLADIVLLLCVVVCC